MKDKRWLPSVAEAEQVVRKFYVRAPDEFLVVRHRVVGEVVAFKFGLSWSTRLSRIVREAMLRLGATEGTFEHVKLWKGVIPEHFELADGIKMSNELRRRKRPVEPAGDAA